nr:MAG TPA: hypothetical protein [Caudoviricetes sp.]
MTSLPCFSSACCNSTLSNPAHQQRYPSAKVYTNTTSLSIFSPPLYERKKL